MLMLFSVFCLLYSQPGSSGGLGNATHSEEKILLEDRCGATRIHHEAIGQFLAAYHHRAAFSALPHNPFQIISIPSAAPSIGIGKETEQRPWSLAVLELEIRTSGKLRADSHIV